MTENVSEPNKGAENGQRANRYHVVSRDECTLGDFIPRIKKEKAGLMVALAHQRNYEQAILMPEISWRIRESKDEGVQVAVPKRMVMYVVG